MSEVKVRASRQVALLREFTLHLPAVDYIARHPHDRRISPWGAESADSSRQISTENFEALYARRAARGDTDVVNPFRFIFGAGRPSSVRNPEPDIWYAVEPRAWHVACSAIDVAAAGRLAEINAQVLAIYEVPTVRALGYMYAYLILCKAGEDLLGLDPTRQEVDELADDLAPEWAAFQNATSVQLRHTLVSALRGTQEGSEIINAHPRIEHAVVAAALVLRRLGSPSANSYLERVTKVLLDYREIRDPGPELEYLRAADSTHGQ